MTDALATSEPSPGGESFRLEDGPVLLYDGECGVCSASVQWILKHERQHKLRFAALQSSLGDTLRQQARVDDTVDSLLWIERSQEGGAQAALWSGAVIEVLDYVGGPWRWLSALRFVPRFLRDAGYRWFARHRTQFAPTSCLLPPPETRARFLA